jgi:peptide-methionine (S)-S-oxide reductase
MFRAACLLRRLARAPFGGSLGVRTVFGGGITGLLPRSECLPGRSEPIKQAPKTDETHLLLGSRLYPPFPPGTETISFGMGCFWCSENVFMRLKGVVSTHVGYAQGVTANPTYTEVSSGRTNHNEVVRVVFDPSVVSLASLLATFFERHDPTTVNRQGNDCGTQYRSGVYYYDAKHRNQILESKKAYENALLSLDSSNNRVVTEVEAASEAFYYAEVEHQQYDARPGTRDYCGLRPLGVPFPRSKDVPPTEKVR